MIVFAAAIVMSLTQADIDHHAAAVLETQQSERESRWYEEAHRQEHERVAVEAAERAQEVPRAVTATGTWDGVLARIRGCESGGNYQAKNPRSTASGAYQAIDSTWRAYRGSSTAPRASLASPAEQDAMALRLYADQGTTPWLASRGCWGG